MPRKDRDRNRTCPAQSVFLGRAVPAPPGGSPDRLCRQRPGANHSQHFRRYAQSAAAAVWPTGKRVGQRDQRSDRHGTGFIRTPSSRRCRLKRGRLCPLRAWSRSCRPGPGRGWSSSAMTSSAVAAMFPWRRPARCRTIMSWVPATRSWFRCAARKTANCAPRSIATARWCCRGWRPFRPRDAPSAVSGRIWMRRSIAPMWRPKPRSRSAGCARSACWSLAR